MCICMWCVCRCTCTHWYTSVAFPHFCAEIKEEMKNLKKIPNTIYCVAQGYVLEKILQTEQANKWHTYIQAIIHISIQKKNISLPITLTNCIFWVVWAPFVWLTPTLSTAAAVIIGIFVSLCCCGNMLYLFRVWLIIFTSTHSQ